MGLGQRVGWNRVDHRVAARALLLVLRLAAVGHHLRHLLAVGGWWYARNLLSLSDDKRASILFRGGASVVGGLVAFDGVALFVGGPGARVLGELLAGQAVGLAHAVFGVAELLAVNANFSDELWLLGRFLAGLEHQRLFIVHFY